MLHRPKHLSSLKPTEQTHLANLLTLPPHHLTATGHPSPAWLATQAYLISNTIPVVLRAPQTLLARLLTLTTTTTTPRAVLCPAHSGLNTRLIRAVFSLLTEELGRKARPLRRFSRHPNRYHMKAENETLICGLVARMAGVAALWLEPEEFARANPGLRTRHVFVEGGCEACILALVGGDEDVLRDLWAAVAGRTHKRKVAPMLSCLVAAWMENLDNGEEVRRESEELGRVVKTVRRAVWRQRHKKRKSRPASISKSRCGRGRARDSGYGSATGSGGELATWTRLGDQVAEMGEHTPSVSSCGLGWNDCDEDEPFVRTAVEYDVFLRKREPSLSQQPDDFKERATVPAPSPHSITESCWEEDRDDVYSHERRPVPYQRQPCRDALGTISSSTNSMCHSSHPVAAEEDRSYDDDSDNESFDETQLGAWLNAHRDTGDIGIHPASLARGSLVMGLTSRDDGRRSIGAMNRAEPLAMDLVDNFSQSGETYDPACWTDVSVATRESSRGWVQMMECCGSSSVYSTADTAVPHPPVPAASTLVGGHDLQKAFASNIDLARAAWPNPFRDPIPTITNTTGRGSGRVSGRGSQTLPFTQSSQCTAAGIVGGSNLSAFLSPGEFQRALDRLEELSLVEGNGGTIGIADGTILPGESISAVGRCVCMTRALESQAKGARATCEMW